MTGQGAWAAAAVYGLQQGRVRRGRRAYRAGLEAEEQVSGHYAARGATILARRWRVAEGEIDLVVAWPGTVAFVEVKSGLHAVEAISERQWQRLEAAALRFTVEHETGDAVVRFDAAFVGIDGALDIVENARGF
jgi:putative endonuclease